MIRLVFKLKVLLLKFKTLIKFGITGVINTGVDFLVFTLLQLYTPVEIGISQGLAYTAGIINSFILNKLWTFNDSSKDKKSSVQLIQFICINLISLIFSYYGIIYLNKAVGVNEFIAKIIITLFTQVINFVGYRLWVFKK